jgi:hypothetical protein
MVSVMNGEYVDLFALYTVNWSVTPHWYFAVFHESKFRDYSA